MSSGIEPENARPMSPADRECMAGEYVLGLLESEERREAERMLGIDHAFQAAVGSWQGRFAELDATVTPISAGDALWRRIEVDLGAVSVAQARIGLHPSAATPLVVPDPRHTFRALWRSLPFWRGAGLAGAFANIVLAVGLGFLARQGAPQPVMVAVLLTDANQPAGLINTYRNGQAELAPFAGLQIPQGRALEVWSIAGPNQNPVSVGLVTEPRTLSLNLQRVQNLGPNHTFAISVEPPQGSPTGLPTGPVLMHGTTSTRL